MLIVKQKPFQLLYLIINFFYAQRLIRVIVLPEIYCQKQQLCEEFGTFNVKWCEKFLSVRWFYLYSVEVHAVDIIQQLGDER